MPRTAHSSLYKVGRYDSACHSNLAYSYWQAVKTGHLSTEHQQLCKLWCLDCAARLACSLKLPLHLPITQAHEHQDPVSTGLPVVVGVGLVQAVPHRRGVVQLLSTGPFKVHVGATHELGTKLPALTACALHVKQQTVTRVLCNETPMLTRTSTKRSTGKYRPRAAELQSCVANMQRRTRHTVTAGCSPWLQLWDTKDQLWRLLCA